MDFRLLGPLEVAGDEGSLTLGGIKQRSLLAMLLLHANQLVSTNPLIDALWGRAPLPRNRVGSSYRLTDALWGAWPPFTCGKRIRVYASRLRKPIGANRIM